MADVAGHGLAASLLACETRALIRAAAMSTDSLVDIVARANELLYRDLRNERFVVLFLGALDCATGRRVRWRRLRAAHLSSAGRGRLRPTDSTMAPLGIFPALRIAP